MKPTVNQVLLGRRTVFPPMSHVKNIGFDGSGVHCPDNEESNPTQPSSDMPRLVAYNEDPALDYAVFCAGTPSLASRIINRVKEICKK